MRLRRWCLHAGSLVVLAAIGVSGCVSQARGPVAANAPVGAHSRSGTGVRASAGAGKASATAAVTADALPAAQFSPSQPPPAWAGPLPYPVLIADENNDRMIEVTPDKKIVWQDPPSGQANSPLGVPGDDTFFSPDGKSIVTNDEDGGTILRISYYAHTVLWHFGVAGQLGADSTHLNYPDDAYLLPNGNTIVADIRNCRELTISPDAKIIASWGTPQKGYCQTDLSKGLYGYPNGDTPQANGDILMTFISGNKVALLSPTGTVIWQTTAPNLHGGYVSDAQLLPDGDVLVASYGKPGMVVIFNPRTGKITWEYRVLSGDGELNFPSLAEMLPNGNVILNDDRNHRVIVIDPKTSQIVWQYGHTGVAGSGTGDLNNPDGIDIDYFRDWQGWLKANPGYTPASGTSTAPDSTTSR